MADGAAGARLRYAIAAPGPRVPAWIRACHDALAAGGHATLCAFIEGPAADAAWRGGLTRIYAAARLRRVAALRPVDAGAWTGGAARLRLGAALRRAEAAFDFVLWGGAGDPPERLAGLARHGVWAFRHGAPAPGAPPGWHEAATAAAALEVALVRFGAGGRTVLHAGAFKTHWEYGRSLETALTGAADWPARVCAELRLSGELPRAGADLRAPAGPTPGVAAFAWRQAAGAARRLVGKLFVRDIWNVGLVRRPVDALVRDGRLARVRWVRPHAPGAYLADPFALREGDGIRVLAEDYRYGAPGRISAFRLPEAFEDLRLEPVFARPEHMSYPYVFTAEGATWCVPETGAAGKVLLYRRAGGAWALERVLIDGAVVVDGTLFEHDGRWWLFGTGAAHTNEKLLAWFAPALRGPWRPHPLNPLKCDIRSARPAGPPFRLDGRLCRPAQDGAATYGGAIAINEIVELSPTRFAERTIARIEPERDGPYPHGAHTLVPLGDACLVDGKRFAFSPFWLLRERMAARRPPAVRSGSGGPAGATAQHT